jgi:hypothetical protein
LHHLADRNDRLAGEVSAFLRKNLIFNLDAGRDSSTRIVRTKLIAFPNPVSASTIIGTETESAIARAASATSVIVVNPISGAPSCMLANPAPVKYTTSKPKSSMTRANNAFAAPGAVTAARCAMMCFNCVVGRMPSCLAWLRVASPCAVIACASSCTRHHGLH